MKQSNGFQAVSADDSKSRIKNIDASLALHEIISSVRQLTYMKQHCITLLDQFDQWLKRTYDKAPSGRTNRRQSYELNRAEKADSFVRERLLEKLIWKQWAFDAVSGHGKPFVPGVCQFIQSYQMPLQGTWDDVGWGKLDLIGATPNALPAVIELKQEGGKDTPLRMLVEAVAYACAVRRAWDEGPLQAEWSEAMQVNGLTLGAKAPLSELPVILVAPADFWKIKIGVPGKRSNGKVRDDAWRPFLELTRHCKAHGLPIHFVQFDITDPGPTVTDMSSVKLPGDDLACPNRLSE